MTFTRKVNYISVPHTGTVLGLVERL